MIKLLVWGILIYVGYRVLQGFLKTKPTPESQAKPVQGEETFRDPVCGTYVSASDAVIGRVDGERFHFCSRECLEKYRVQLEEQAALKQ
jgi:YHS domain-containing protein